MVSAVFHSPLDASAAVAAKAAAVTPVLAAAPSTAVPPATVAAAPPRAARRPFDLRVLWMRVLPPVLGFGLLLLLWELIAMGSSTGFPSPIVTAKQAMTVFSDPFYSKGPNDQGVGWNVLASLQRVALGFGLAAAVGIPAGFAIGRFEFLSRMFNP
ncbi:MAG: nitrate ABC transporter, permease protein, partial [Comamonadaceae bacterium]